MGNETSEAPAKAEGTAGEVPAPKPGLNREFRKLWSATGSSAIGDGVALAAAPLMATALTDDPRLIAGVTMALTLPYAILGLPVGVLVDRLDRRRTMAIIDFIRAGALVLFTLLVVVGQANLIALYACFFLVGAFETFFRNAAQAIVPNVVSRDLLVDANSRLAATETVAIQFVGPMLGAGLFTLSPSLPFGLDAISFLVSAILLSRLRMHTPMRLRPPGPDGKQPPILAGLFRDMGTGIRWLLRHKLLSNLNIISGLFNMVLSGALAVLVVYVQRTLKLSDVGYGVLLACEALGAVIASKASPALVRAVGREWTLVLVGVIQLVAGIALWLTPWAWLAGAAVTLSGFGVVTFNVVVVALRQTLIPDELQGRVNSVYRLVAWGSIPIGAALAGMISHTFGPPAVYAAGAIVTALITVRLVIGAFQRWITVELEKADAVS